MNNPIDRTAHAASADSAANTPQTPSPLDGVEAQASAPTATKRRRWPLIAGATAIALVATGAVAYGSAKKTVQLDIDGNITTVSTFAGSIEGLLDEQDVRVTDRDLIAPGADAPLKNGADVVVRYGRQVTVQTDGAQSDVCSPRSTPTRRSRRSRRAAATCVWSRRARRPTVAPSSASASTRTGPSPSWPTA